MDEKNSNTDQPNFNHFLVLNSDNGSEKSSSKKVNFIDDKKTNEEILELGNEIIENFLKIKKCSILRYGIKVSPIKIEYGFCNTCDINLMHPICSACLENCHEKYYHSIKRVKEPNNIICGCGERMHHFQLLAKKTNLKKSNKCPYTELCEKSKSKIYYIVKGKYICEFCYHLCGYEGKGKCIEKNEKFSQICECESLNGTITHIDLKLIYKKFNDVVSQASRKILNMDPTEFLNLLFISRSSYEYLFIYFEEMIQNFYLLDENNKMDLKDNFTSSNFYKILTIFTVIVEKNTNTPIRYYVPEIVEKLSFSLIQNVINFIEFKDTKSYWNFFSKILYLYKKVNIGCCTMYMDKYKLYDLENFSPLQRNCIYHNNIIIFPGATEQINFFIKFLDYLLTQEIKSIEGYDVIIQICAILKRLSVFYLFDSMNMTKFCFVLDKMFSFFHKQKSITKQIELYYIIIKMLTFFIYCYNDNCFYTFITENKKEELSKVKFVYHKNELGRLISRNVIRIMYYILIISKYNMLNRRQTILTEKIQNYGLQIISLLLTEKDSYFLFNQEKENHQYKFLKIISLQTHDPKYKMLMNEVKIIEQKYLDYFSFEADIKDVVNELDTSLDKILASAKNVELRGYIAKTNYFFLICKVLYIIDFNIKGDNYDDEEYEINQSFISNLFSFLFYFIENSADNAILITSHYITKVLLKLPDDYTLEIFKLYAKFSKLISKNKGYICHPEKIVEILFDYLVKYKQNSQKKWSKIARDFFVNDATILDQILFLFLNIIIKLFLETKLLYPLESNKNLKILLTKMFGIFKFSEINNYNMYLILILINKIFEPCLEKDRKTVLKLCLLDNLINILEDINIELDFRTEILIFIYKFKCSIFLKQEESKNNSYKKSLTKMGKPKVVTRKSVLIRTPDLSLATDSISDNISISSNNTHNSIHTHKSNNTTQTYKRNKRNTTISLMPREKSGTLLKKDLLPKEKIYDMNINTLFNLSSEEKTKKNDYLNAIVQNFDDFVNIKNIRLISNNQLPTKYLSFYYFLIKSDETIFNSCFKNIEFGIDIFEKEVKRFIDIYKNNSYRPTKVFKFCIKGILLTILPTIKLLFCFTAKAKGKILLKLYRVIMKMLYVKNFIIDKYYSLSINENFKIPDFENFDFEKFISPEKQDESLKDFFLLKERNKFSPYDYTHLWDILERNFLNYIKYPESINLEEKFPPKYADYISYGNMKDETDLLDEFSLRLKKKLDSNKNNRSFNNNLGSAENLDELQKSVEIGRSNKFYNNSSTKNVAITEIEYGTKMLKTKLLTFGLKGNTEQEKEKVLLTKIKKIYDFYINEKINIKEEDSSLLISLEEICTEREVNFRRMLLCLMVNLSKESDENIFLGWSVIYKLLLVATSETQNNIIENLGDCSKKKDLGFIINMNNKLYKTLLNILINDFCYEFTKYKANQTYIILISKIFKLLCLEHNNFFQEKFLLSLDYNYKRLIGSKKLFVLNKSYSIISNSQIDNVSNFSRDNKSNENNGITGLFDFLIFILQKILLISNCATEVGHLNYLYDIFYGIIELLVEIIQGNKTEILTKSKDKENDNRNTYILYSFKIFISVASQILFNDNLITGSGFKTRLLLISFFIAILEEKTNEEIQKMIMKHLALNKVLYSMKYTLKNYFYEKTYNNPKYRKYYSNYSEKQINQKEFIFDHNLYEFYKNNYFNVESCKESKEFELANSYYRYIKKLSINKKSHEAEDLVKQVNKLSLVEAKKKFELFNKKIIKSNSVTPINLINEKEKFISINFIENYYLIKFFEYITKIVEIRLPKEQRNVKVIFTVPNEMMHLTEMSKSEFVRIVDRNSETSKKFELLRNIPLFQLEIEYFKNTKVGIISKIILKMDYVYVQVIMYIYAVLFLIFMLFTLEGYKVTKPEDSSNDEDRRLRNLFYLRKLYTIPKEITNSIDQSIKEWGNVYDIIDYTFCALNGILILSWIIVKSPLYYILDKSIYIEENKLKSEEELNFFDKLYISLYKTIIIRDYITTLSLMFIISLIGAIMKRGEITYAFCLIAILNLNKTLRSIAISIKDRGPELGASFLLLIFLVYFYSNIGFFYFNKNFDADIEEDISDNYCLSLTFCFMTNFDAGIRARGGAADQMVRISYERNKYHYFTRVIYDFTYFLINIIIMIDLVFGIILGTFSEMREEERKYDNDKINHCFLCHMTREMAEKRKEDFNYHREKKHYLWDYVEYMIFLKFSDFHTLNAINSYSRNNLDKKNICFLPSCQDQFQEESESQDDFDYNVEEEEYSDISEYLTSWENSEISKRESSVNLIGEDLDYTEDEKEDEEEEEEGEEEEDEEGEYEEDEEGEEEEEEVEVFNNYENNKNIGDEDEDDVIVNENMVI